MGSKAGSARPLPFGGVEARVRGDQALPPRFPQERYGRLPAREYRKRPGVPRAFSLGEVRRSAWRNGGPATPDDAGLTPRAA